MTVQIINNHSTNLLLVATGGPTQDYYTAWIRPLTTMECEVDPTNTYIVFVYSPTFTSVTQLTTSAQIVAYLDNGTFRTGGTRYVQTHLYEQPARVTAIWHGFTAGMLISMIPALMYVMMRAAKRGIKLTNDNI